MWNDPTTDEDFDLSSCRSLYFLHVLFGFCYHYWFEFFGVIFLAPREPGFNMHQNEICVE